MYFCPFLPVIALVFAYSMSAYVDSLCSSYTPHHVGDLLNSSPPFPSDLKTPQLCPSARFSFHLTHLSMPSCLFILLFCNSCIHEERLFHRHEETLESYLVVRTRQEPGSHHLPYFGPTSLPPTQKNNVNSEPYYFASMPSHLVSSIVENEPNTPTQQCSSKKTFVRSLRS